MITVFMIDFFKQYAHMARFLEFEVQDGISLNHRREFSRFPGPGDDVTLIGP